MLPETARVILFTTITGAKEGMQLIVSIER